MSMWKISPVLRLRTSRNPENHQISHWRYVWGQPRSVTSDDLWKVKMQCQRSDVVICWPKICIISPFQSMAVSSVTENTITVGRRLFLLWHHSSVAWPDPVTFFSPKVAQRMPHKLCKISAQSAQRLGSHFRKKTHGVASTSPPSPTSSTGEG